MTTYQNDIHTCHADCQNPICIEARKSVKAFPFSRKEYVVVEDSINEVDVSQDGMDLRDYFAAKAMQGMLSTENWFGSFNQFKSVDDMTSKYAKEAYLFADAMLKAREQ